MTTTAQARMIQTQRAEFDAVARIAKAYDALPAIVDDDYPEARHYYESAMRDLLMALASNGRAPAFDFRAHLERQRQFSERTFGPSARTKGVADHIRKELAEVEATPDIAEWIDVVILALDGAWRSGATPDQIIAALAAKQAKNEARQWPDWRTMSEDKAIEHVR